MSTSTCQDKVANKKSILSNPTPLALLKLLFYGAKYTADALVTKGADASWVVQAEQSTAWSEVGLSQPLWLLQRAYHF